MILASMGALIVLLALQVGKDAASNIEGRIINGIIGVALDAVNQNQQPQLSELAFGMRTLQKTQDEIKENQKREIGVHYKNGIDFMRYASTVTNRKQKEDFIHKAIESFTYASNIEVGEAAVHARMLVGACFFALRTIDTTTPIDLENGEYEKAFQLAEKTLVFTPPSGQPQPFLASRPYYLSRGLIQQPRRPYPSRELIQQLLKIPYLQQKYGTFEVYWKKWDPPKPVTPPQLSTTGFRAAPSLPGPQRKCVSCGKSFAVSSGLVLMPQYCPECRLKQFNTQRPLGSLAKQQTIRKTCQKCFKQYDQPIGTINLKNYCPECRSKYP